MARSRAAARAAAPFEDIEGVRVERGGKHGYMHVRGGQGRSKNKFQGVSPKKTNRTDLFESPREAAVAYARMLTARVRERQQVLGSILRSSPLNIDFGMSASNLVMPAVRPIGPIIGAPLSSSQAVAAVARGVQVVMAEEVWQGVPRVHC